VRITTVTVTGVALLTVAAVLSGCNGYAAHALTVRANYNVSRGEYQPAIVDYLRARENQLYDAWLAYNLGNVYHYLGESNAALERWDFARSSGAPELVYGANFNRGVYFFEQGRYREARRQFRIALEADPGSIPAKRNLELTLERLTAEADLTGETVPPDGTGDRAERQEEVVSGGSSRMLDYMRRREEQRWRANQQTRVDPDVLDW
jgi:tetratricopeptide (TPR) repeat protein